jgi:hypothetical protein
LWIGIVGGGYLMAKSVKEIRREGGEFGEMRFKINPISSLTVNRKAQEEIMGFMLVVILLVVIGLAMIFLFKPKIEEQRDFQVENMIHSILDTTYEGKDVRSRISECEQGEGCDELGKGLEEITNAAFLNSGLVVGQNLKGYSMNMTGSLEYGLINGQQAGQSIGTLVPVSDALVRLKLYY